MNKFNFNKLTPFKWFVLENFPFLEADFDALTEWQLFCKLGKEMNKIIDSENTLGTQMENVTNAFIELQNYVNNYFKNLDVQDEINNKLNEMAQSGELTEIIAQYLQLAGVLAYDTKTNMKQAQNLVNGSIVKTLGNTTFRDGQGAFFKVRQIQNTDIVDDKNIIALYDTDLVAEKIQYSSGYDLQSQISDINNKLTLLDTKKYVFVGDSYLEGYNPDGNVTSWGTLVKNYMNIPENNVIMSYLGGSSFAGSKSFTNLITSLTADNNVTDVIICGGFNDRTFNRTQIRTGMTSFKNAVNTKFPNAKIHLGFIGWSSNPEYLNSLYNTFVNYTWCANELGIEMYSGCEYSLHNYFNMFASDKIHPTLLGQESIARNLVNCILNGSADVKYNYTNVGFNVSGSASAVSGSVDNFGTTINNDLVELSSQGRIEFTLSNISYIASGVSDIEVATITSGHIIGSSYKICSIPVQLILYGDGKYYNATGILIIRNGKIYISFAHVNASNNNYLSFTALNKIQVMPFSGTLDTMFC